MASHLAAIKRQIDKAWLEFLAKLKIMGPGCAVRPSAAAEIFQYRDGNPIVVEIKPVTFLLKERPDHSNPDMYVVVEGLIHFQPQEDSSFRAIDSKTRVGYFLNRGGVLKHVYGVHYDFDDTQVAHPIFHSQIAPMTRFVFNIDLAWKKRFGQSVNHVDQILNNVRTPSAQMDVFSVLIQLCSDHLVNAKSVRAQLSAYRQMIEVFTFYRGAFSGIPRLQSVIENRCLRPNHWYDGSILLAPATGAPG